MHGVKLLLAVLLSALIFWATPTQAAPVNNSETKAAHTTKAEKLSPKEKEADVTVAKVETPVAQVPEPQPEAVVTPQTPTYSGTHKDLMAAAGISPEDYGAADYIISHESSWNPDATEPTTGAHGLPQALPYSKTGCGWSDAVCQLKWASAYATERYGGWWGAYSQWVAYRWW